MVLLHYEFFHSNISRENYYKKLSDIMGGKYKKNDNHFEKLGGLSKVLTTINNSKKLYENYKKDMTPSKKTPCTTMFRLFDEIECYFGCSIKQFNTNE